MEWTLANAISTLVALLFKSLNSSDTQKFHSIVRLFLQTLEEDFEAKWKGRSNMQISNSTYDQQPQHKVLSSTSCNNINEALEGERGISNEELNVIMNRLQLQGFESERLEDSSYGNKGYGEEDFLGLFNNEEPSLVEIKETFEVFDVNRDGYIDAAELQRVVCNIGLKGRYCELQCQRMIDSFDRNGDGLIDFQEFVKLMERCLG